MNVILYMAISANGMIAKTSDDTSWISKEEWNSYSVAVRKAGNLVVGRRTYTILTQQPEFSEFKDVVLVVVSKEARIQLVSSKHHLTESPRAALDLLKNFKEVVVAGGSILNNAFLAENLIDEIYLDIEPIIISKGIPLFCGDALEQTLDLIGLKKITDNEVQLHYKVKK